MKAILVSLFVVGAVTFSTQPAIADADSAKRAIKAERAVKDVLYQKGQAVEWIVGVISNGQPRFGFASYICEILKEHGISSGRVRIVDIVKVSRGENFWDASLGGVDCKSYRQFKP